VPSEMTPLPTSDALITSVMTEPAATEPWTAHHIVRNARSRRTELCKVPELSSTKRQMAWTPAPLARRSSAAVRRSSIPP
jgi:hypothetical protein